MVRAGYKDRFWIELRRHPEESDNQTGVMQAEEIIATLRANESDLKREGVKHLSLFGSAARGEAGPASDVDIAVQLERTFSTGGLDSFWRLEQLELKLGQLLGRRVDVIPEPVRKRRFQDQIDRDRVLAF